MDTKEKNAQDKIKLEKFDFFVEAMVPIEFQYEIEAENIEEAISKLKNSFHMYKKKIELKNRKKFIKAKIKKHNHGLVIKTINL